MLIVLPCTDSCDHSLIWDIWDDICDAASKAPVVIGTSTVRFLSIYAYEKENKISQNISAKILKEGYILKCKNSDHSTFIILFTKTY